MSGPRDTGKSLRGARAVALLVAAEKIGLRITYGARTLEEKMELVCVPRRSVPGPCSSGMESTMHPQCRRPPWAIAFGYENDITREAADAGILDRSLGKVDELIHIGARTGKTALQSAVGGMVLSAAGMALAAFGWLPPVSGAVAQSSSIWRRCSTPFA